MFLVPSPSAKTAESVFCCVAPGKRFPRRWTESFAEPIVIILKVWREKVPLLSPIPLSSYPIPHPPAISFFMPGWKQLCFPTWMNGSSDNELGARPAGCRETLYFLPWQPGRRYSQRCPQMAGHAQRQRADAPYKDDAPPHSLRKRQTPSVNSLRKRVIKFLGRPVWLLIRTKDVLVRFLWNEVIL